jgi:virulence factor Mce-like protein
MRGQRRTSILASPVLVGAVTILIVAVAVILAVNANQGLPFVPTYDVKAELPGGANLVVGNEVRVGGAHMGFVEEIEPTVDPDTGRTIAIIHMKLDSEIKPIPKSTVVRVRPRSVLGLKYVALEIPEEKPTGDEVLRDGETLPMRQEEPPVEFDEFLSVNTPEHRENQQRVLTGAGNVFTGRGPAINEAIHNFVPFFVHLTPVMEALSDPDTRLNQLFRQLGRTANQIARVAPAWAQLFGNIATTNEALGRHEEQLRQMIERGPRDLEEGIRSFPIQRDFNVQQEELFVELAPTARELRRSLPGVSDAFETGTPVQRRSPRLFRNNEKFLVALEDLVENPDTLLALKDLTTLVKLAAPLIEYAAPYQTVCNYFTYFWTFNSDHISEPVRNGTIQRVLLKNDNRTQDDRFSSTQADIFADVDSGPGSSRTDGGNAKGAKDVEGNPEVRLQRQAYFPAIDAQGNADCQGGQGGYPEGPLVEGNRYGTDEKGGRKVILDPDLPGNRGPTLTGVPRLQDVP